MRVIRPLALILACFLAGMVVADYMLPWLADSSRSISANRAGVNRAGVDVARLTPYP